MKKFSKSTILTLFTLIGVTYGIWSFYYQQNTSSLKFKSFYPSRSEWVFLEKAIQEIVFRWNYPDRIKEIDWTTSECEIWDFSKFNQPHDLRQNPYVFECYLSNSVRYFDSSKTAKNQNKISVSIEGKTKTFTFVQNKIKSLFKYVQYKQFDTIKSDLYPTEHLLVNLAEEDNSANIIQVVLPFNQSEKYLPKAKYFYGQDLSTLPKQLRDRLSNDTPNNKLKFAKVRSWDNLNRDFLIDKYPVRNFQVENILKNLNLTYDKSNRGEFSLRLLKDLQRQVCLGRGMEPLQAYVWDAATYFRDPVTDAEGLHRSLYFFGDRWDEKNYCNIQPTTECKKKFSPLLVEDSLTWMGVGGVSQFFESFENEIDPYFNIKTSSMFYSKNSAWQILAHRFHWSGEGFLKEDRFFISSISGITTNEVPLGTQFGVAFRCMKQMVTYP